MSRHSQFIYKKEYTFFKEIIEKMVKDHELKF